MKRLKSALFVKALTTINIAQIWGAMGAKVGIDIGLMLDSSG